MFKFYIGEPVIHINGNRFELGVVKKRYELPTKYYWNNREVHMFSYLNKVLRLYSKNIKRAIVCLYLDYNLENTECTPITNDLAMYLLETTDAFISEQHYVYHIWYHTGDAVVCADESDLREISNSYAFTILRKQADEDIKAPSTCKERASKIMLRFGLEPSLHNRCVHLLTRLLENKGVESLQIDSEILRCAVRIEVIDLLDAQNLEYTESDITFILDIIFDNFTCSVLNMEVIEDAIKSFKERGGLNGQTTDC